MSDKPKDPTPITAIEDSWRQETPVERPADGWDEIEASISAHDEATMNERARCEALVRGEIERGRLRGVPDTAGAMILLNKIAMAIQNG